jgi:hypothetical protein
MQQMQGVITLKLSLLSTTTPSSVSALSHITQFQPERTRYAEVHRPVKLELSWCFTPLAYLRCCNVRLLLL